jgi:aspartyl-tRNA synthetase
MIAEQIRTHPNRIGAGEVRLEHAGQHRLLEGWVHRRRDFGELIFLDIRDRSGLCQVVVDHNRVPDPGVVTTAKELRAEYVVRIEGEIVQRATDRRNPKIPTGDVELLASGIEILSRAETPPFPIEEEALAAEELRLRHRYLDLRRPTLTRNLILRDRISFLVREYMHRHGFLEVETPILTKSTPEGARDYLVPSRVQKGNFYALPQSPQLFKQLLMVSGFERYYQIAKCFRDEDLRSDRQPEFTQVDIEASFIDEEFIFSLIEGMFAHVFPVAGIPVLLPFPRMSWDEAMERFGIDRPDTRFGMELSNVKLWAETLEFPVMRQAASVRAIVVPGGGSFSRKRIDELTEYAKSFGAPGLIWVKLGPDAGSSIKKYLTPAATEQLRHTTQASEADLILIVAGDEAVVFDSLANLRLRIAREEKMIPQNRWDFLWVVDFPLFELDRTHGRYGARHHPFTAPAVRHLPSFDQDLGAAKSRAYDVVLNGLELGGGSIRINSPEVQQRMFRALGISEQEGRERFGFLLEAFRYGAPPHGGIALGFDRMVMMMAGASSLRDVIAFPKTTSGQDLMTDAPSAVPPEQLDELGLSLRPRS